MKKVMSDEIIPRLQKHFKTPVIIHKTVSSDALKLEFAMNQQIETLNHILGESIFSYEDKPIEKIIFEKLENSGLTVSTAESCTGGNIAHRLTLIPGVSECFKGSVVAYHNDVKIKALGVSSDDLMQHGAVSREVAEQMAEGVRKLTQADLAVSTTGIAGPSGGTEEKPVGRIWIAACSKERIISRCFTFGNLSRENFIERSTMAAFMILNELI
ncbi:MAG: competence/damage-inducible protein cinA [Bacteroidetes bacterium]|nr:competence/damage-inducible protein cinA [Bacteroidota bacterium]